MSSILNLLESLLPHIPSQSERDEAYLAESVDHYDLERRMRELDGRGRNPAPNALTNEWVAH